MDIQLEKQKIVQKLIEVDDAWLLRAIQRLLGINETVEDEFVKRYEASLKPMTKAEMQRRALEAEEDIKAGRYVELEAYLKSIEAES